MYYRFHCLHIFIIYHDTRLRLSGYARDGVTSYYTDTMRRLRHSAFFKIAYAITLLSVVAIDITTPRLRDIMLIRHYWLATALRDDIGQEEISCWLNITHDMIIAAHRLRLDGELQRCLERHIISHYDTAIHMVIALLKSATLLPLLLIIARAL